jgi:hypothetical protein
MSYHPSNDNPEVLEGVPYTPEIHLSSAMVEKSGIS